VLLDEVLSGLTPAQMTDALKLVRRIRDRGTTVVFVEHIMHAVLDLADRVVVLSYGQVIAEDCRDTWCATQKSSAPISGKPMLEITNLEVAHGEAVAVGDVSLGVRARELVAVVGRTAPARPR